VAEELGIDIGLMILAGCAVGLVSSSAGFCFAQFVNRRNELPLRESPDFSLTDLEQLSKRDERELPPLVLALLPIGLPVVLIAGYTVLKAIDAPLTTAVMDVAATLGNKNIALAIAAAIAMGTLVWQKRASLKELAGSVQAALASGGVIILITAAGGAFGGMMQQTNIAGLIEQLPTGSPVAVIGLAFLITMAIRTAQGSATVAMITSVGILSGLAQSSTLGCHPVFLALAIGCGSKPIAWMNDSGFWVICKMSGMTEAEGLRYVAPMSIVMGVAGLVATMVGAVIVSM
nr:GntP family permease [Planctomycetota bacterium]